MQLRSNIITALALVSGLFFSSTTQAQVPVDEEDPYADLELFTYAHGFRMGYGYINGVDKSHEVLTTPSLFVLGYEINQRLLGGEGVDIIFSEVLAISGMNQGLFIPTGNFLIGAEFSQAFRVSSGIHISPLSTTGDIVHMIAALGYSVDAGRFNLPIDVAWIPDTDPERNAWRGFMTVGVNW